jgi:hypothetical protein
MPHKGSVARAALPVVLHLEWGWHRGERAMERGKFLLNELFDQAYQCDPSGSRACTVGLTSAGSHRFRQFDHCPPTGPGGESRVVR